MPRYFFNIREHDTLHEDLLGTDLPNDDLAYQEAVVAAREMMSERVRDGVTIDGQVFEVMNDAGEVIHKVPLKSVIKID